MQSLSTLAVEELLDTCPVHGPFVGGALMISGKQVMRRHCPRCLDDREATSEVARAALEGKARQGQAEARWRALGAPARFEKASLDTYLLVGDTRQQHAIDRARWFAETWPQRRELGTSMILSGKPGTGKTHLAIGIARAVVAAGASARYSSVSDAMRGIRQSYGDGAKRTEAQAIEVFVAPDLLVLDEVGAGGGSEHEHKMFFEIANKRYEHARCTLLVSNLMGEDLRTFLGDRVLDRMRDGGGKLLAFEWASYRK